MKKKILTMIVSVAMVVTFIPIFAFAGENSDATLQDEPAVVLDDAEAVADVIENVVGDNDVIDDVEDEGDFVVEGEYSEIVIPEDASGEVTIESCTEDVISMELPEEFSDIGGELAGDGTIVYAEEETDAALAVQAVQELQDDICLDGFRSLITIENAQAQHDYSFHFDLPEGAKLVQDGDYINIINENNMVADENGENPEPELLGVIEPAWARDANGVSINTFYTINGNTLTQTVEFDENSAFPIVADPNLITTVIKLAVKASHYNAHRSYTVFSTKNGKRYKVTYKAIPKKNCYLCKYKSY